MDNHAMPLSSPFAPEVFQRHAAALRALAGALLRERADAEDALQETWLAYLKSPPARSTTLGGWLATVMRRRASNLRRAEARRSNHELDSSGPHSFDPREAQAREATLQAVVAAVSALDEPLRHVVLLRYFEGLAPRDVAARMGLAPSIVYDRLHRAHSQLRKRLEGEFGSKRALALALGALTGEDAPLATSPSQAAHAAIRAPWIASPIAVGAAATLFAVVLVVAARDWVRRLEATRDRGVPAAVLTATPLFESRESASRPSDPAQDARGPREPVGGEAGDARERGFPSPTFEYELQLTVLDEFDRTCAHQAVHAAPAGGTLNLVGGTDVDGRCKLLMRGWTEAAELDFAFGDEAAGNVRRIALRAGAQSLVLRGTPPATRSLNDERIAGFRFEDAKAAARLSTLSAQATRSEQRASRDAGGWITFVEPRLAHAMIEQEDMPPEEVEGLSDLTSEESLAMSPDVSGVVDSSSSAHGSLVGTLIDEAGAVVAGALVSLRRADEGDWNVAATDESGEYTFEALPTGAWVVHAGGGDVPRALGRVTIAAGERARWDTRLERGEVLEGVLLDSNRQPLKGWTVEAEGREGADVARTDAQGRFEIPNAPRSALRLLAKPQAFPEVAAIRVATGVHAADGPRSFELAHAAGDAPGELRVEVVDSELDASRSCEVRVWRTDSERGVVAAWIGSAPGRRTARARLLAGEHRVEVLVAGREPRVLHPVFVAAGAVHEVAVDAIAPGARVSFLTSSERRASHTMLLRTGACFDVLASLPSSDASELRAGAYSLWDALETRWLADLAADSGAVFDVELDLASRRRR